jgi:hypothetical protein
MQQGLGEAQTASRHTHAPHRGDAWHHHTRGRNAGRGRGGTTAKAGALLVLALAWSVPWYEVAAGSTAAGMARDARSGAPLLAVGIGILSWLGALIIVAALLFGGMLLLNTLVHQYWLQDVRQVLDSVLPATAAPEDEQQDGAVVVRE